MKFNVHAGHNRDGFVGCGAGGVFTESTAARQVKDVVIRLLRDAGHEVYDCTVDEAPSVNDNLSQIVAKCNAHSVDLDISIHFNAYDGTAHGTEVLVYSSESASNDAAQNIVNSISALGFTNRGVKVRNGLYVLRRTNSPALLVECCFCDSEIDAGIYNPDTMGAAIVSGIFGTNIQPNYTTPEPIQASIEAQPATPEVDWGKAIAFCIACGQAEARAFLGDDSIEVDGKFGPQTHNAKVRVLQLAMNKDYHDGYVSSNQEELVIDGDFGGRSWAALDGHYIKRGETQWMVTAMEIIALCNGTNPDGVEFPGTYGGGMTACYGTEYLDSTAIKDHATKWI